MEGGEGVKPHTALYLKAMGYDISSFIPCECCGARSVDTHHIEARSMGGTKKPDRIENLMALCRKCHIEFGDKKQHMDYLKEIHALRMKERGVNLTGNN